MIDDSTLPRLTLTAYEAVTDASKWKKLAEDLRRAFKASSVYFRAPSPLGEARTVWWVDSETEPQATLQYLRRWGAHDPWPNHSTEHAASIPGRILIGGDSLPWHGPERTAFYNDFGRGTGLRSAMPALVDHGQHPVGARQTRLAMFRQDHLPEFEHRELHAFQALEPALRSALHAHWALHRRQIEASAVEQAFEVIPAPVFVVRRRLEVEFANRAANALGRDCVARAGSGAISRIGQLDSPRLQALMDTAARGAPVAAGIWVAHDGSHASTATLHLSRIAPDSAMADQWPRAEALVLIQFDDAERAKATRLQALAQRCRLTASELQVLQRLADGASAQQVAQTQSLRLSTVRTHIRHLLDKTHSGRLVDLLRVLGA